jgi:hypothetical protein
MGLAIVPTFSSTLNILSCLFIMSEIVHDYRIGEMNPIKRALFGVTIFEICGGFGWFLAGWALPKGTDFVLAAGTNASCNFQGFLVQLIVGATLFNGVLQYMFYLLVTGKSNLKQVQSIEWKAYTIITIFTFLSALMPLLYKQYNPMNQLCWINGYPSGCNEAVFGGSDYPCERGFNSQWTGIFLFYFIVWANMIFIIILNILVVRHLVQTDNNQDSVWTAKQGMLYSAAFLVTWLPSTISTIAFYSGSGGYQYEILCALLEPLQGFWNALIILRTNQHSVERLASMLRCSCCKSVTNNEEVIAESNMDDVQNKEQKPEQKVME